jgi:hypothetical protein
MSSSILVKSLSLAAIVVLVLCQTASSAVIIDLLSQVNLSQDVVNGNWQLVNGMLVDSDSTAYARLAFPYHPPLEYDYTVVFSLASGSNPWDNMAQFVSHGNVPFTFSTNAGTGHYSRLEDINGHSVIGNPTLTPYTFLSGVEYTSTVEVRNDHVVSKINGQTLINYSTNYSDLSRNPAWTLPDQLELGVGGFGPMTVYSATVTVPSDPVPEPTTLIIWSLLGSFGIAFGYWQRKRAT